MHGYPVIVPIDARSRLVEFVKDDEMGFGYLCQAQSLINPKEWLSLMIAMPSTPETRTVAWGWRRSWILGAWIIMGLFGIKLDT